MLGIEIGGTKLQLVLGDQAGLILERRKLAVDRQQGAAGIRAQIEQALPGMHHGRALQAVGVGFGGPVDWRTGRICRSHQIEGWSGFDLGGWLCQLCHAPVRVDNDANVAALGEARHGAGQGHDPVFYVTLGSGVGGGLVINGSIYHGAALGEAEFGHIRLDRAGTTIESRCSGWAVDKRIRSLAETDPHSRLGPVLAGTNSGGEARHLGSALQQGDLSARRLLNEIAADLALGLSHVVHLFHPQVIVIGGGLSGIGEPLRAAVDQSLHAFVMEAFAPGPEVALAMLGEDAVPRGALELSKTPEPASASPSALSSLSNQKHSLGIMKQWIQDYVRAQNAANDSIPVQQVADVARLLAEAHRNDRQVFVFGNGGSAANASHFATDLGKGASDKIGKRFRVLSLTDNVSWLTALGNDYAYEDIFVRQLENYGKPSDVVIALSVSGNSPNCVKALEWSRESGLKTVALVGAKRGRMAEVAEHVLVINDTHYGRVEDAQMGICHLLCYAFMENPQLAKG